jgi:hypothetical protein
VYAHGLSTPELVEGLRRGRCYVAESSAVTLILNASRDNGPVTVRPGETLTVPAGAGLTQPLSVIRATLASGAPLT